VDADVPLFVYGEEIATPVIEVVDLGGFGGGPAFGYHIITSALANSPLWQRGQKTSSTPLNREDAKNAKKNKDQEAFVLKS
jgi:hypothetical protein